MLQTLSRFHLSKKHFAVLIAILLLIIGIFYFYQYNSSRSGTESDSQLVSRIASSMSGGFTADLDIHWNDFAAAAQFEQRYIGDCTFRFTSPPSLEGFEMTLADKKVSLTYHGISSETDANGLFSSSGAGMFLQAVEGLAAQQGLEYTSKDGILLFTIPADTKENQFCASFDAQTGALLKVEFPQENFSIQVSNFTSN